MKTPIRYLAGLALAATVYTLPTIAQGPPGGPPPVLAGAPHPPKGNSFARTQIENDDEDGPLAAARAASADAERTVRKIFAGGEFSSRPLIINSSDLDEKAAGNLDEDLNIMARVLDKSVDHGGDDGDKAMGIHLWAIGGGNRSRNMYIDGYGAILFVNVNMPLQAPAAKAQAEEKKEETSSTWEEAKKELYGRDDARREGKRGHPDRKPGPPYDAERVEEMKKSLIEAMKNATHIRGVKGDEYVTIVVQGPAPERSGTRSIRVGPEGKFDMDVFAFAGPGGGSGARSVMTLRAKKSDIDAFAKNNSGADEFTKKVTVAVYQSSMAPSGGSDLRFR